jgi:hypothetical protein
MVATQPFEIHHAQISALRNHPAKLAVVRMHGSFLSRLPANGHDFEQVVTVNHVPGVELFIEEDIRFQRRIADLHAVAKIQNAVACDDALFKRTDFGDEIINAD